jgi:hypothetical protein
MNDADSLTKAATLVDILEANRGVDRAVTYVDGENSERRVAYGEVYSLSASCTTCKPWARSAATR